MDAGSRLLTIAAALGSRAVIALTVSSLMETVNPTKVRTHDGDSPL